MIKEVYLKQVNGVSFAARSNSNHWVMMDSKHEFGGSEAAAFPKELVLMALAGCTSADIIPILKKKKSSILGYECNVKGVERDEHPKIFTEIHVEYVFYGDGIKTEDVEHAIDLSVTKYCSVSAILSASAKLTHSYRIEPATKLME